MVFRLNNTGLNASAPNFRGGSIAAAGAQVAQGVGQAVGALDGILQKEAELFYETQLTDFGLGLDADLSEMARNALGGEGFQEGATKLYDARKAEIYKRAGANPYKRKMLDEYFRKSEGKAKAGFENTQRELGIEYSTFLHGQHRDDAMQEAGRQTYVGESNAPSVGNYKARLARRESGGRKNPYSVVNQFGYTGKYQWGQAHLDYITGKYGMPKMRLKDIKGNAALQERLQDLSIRDEDEYIVKKGYDKLIGTKVGGVLITRDGLRAAMHGHGKGSLDKFMRSGGAKNHADGNGMKIATTMRNLGSDDNGVPVYNGPIPDVFANPAVAARRDDLFAQIDAMDITANQKAELKAETTSMLAQAGLTQIANENPSAALAALRSGQYDAAISYKFDQSLQGSAEGDIERQRKAWETQITDIAKQQQKALKNEAVGMALDHNAWQAGGRVGEAPPALSDEHYGALTVTQQRAYDRAAQVGEAVAGARQVDPAQADEYLEGLRPSGEGFDGEADAFAAAQEVLTKRVERQNAVDLVESAAAAGVPPPMKADGVKAVIDEQFSGVQSISEGAVFAADHRVIPEGFKQMISQALGSNNVELQVEAVEAVAALQVSNPKLIADASKFPALKRAIGINHMMKREGLTPEEAIKRSAQFSNPGTTPERQRNREFWKSDRKEHADVAMGKFLERLKDRGEANGWSGREAEAAIPSGVWETFSDIVEDEFALTGNMDLAVEYAELSFFRTHGVSHIGGQAAWVRGSAESAYPLYEDSAAQSAWIEQQALDRVPGATSVRLIPQGDPVRENEPTYMVVGTMPDGSQVFADAPFQPSLDDQIMLSREAGRLESPNTAVVDEAMRTKEALQLEKQRVLVDVYRAEQDLRNPVIPPNATDDEVRAIVIGATERLADFDAVIEAINAEIAGEERKAKESRDRVREIAAPRAPAPVTRGRGDFNNNGAGN